MGDLLQQEHPKITVEREWGSWAQKPEISLKRCKMGPKLLWRANRKSHTRFRLVPKSMTSVDVERPKRNSCEKKVLRAHQKNFNKNFLMKIERRNVSRCFLEIQGICGYSRSSSGTGVKYNKCYAYVHYFSHAQMFRLLLIICKPCVLRVVWNESSWRRHEHLL